MSKEIKAINKTTILKPLYEKKSTSGIVIPETAKKYKKYDAEVVGEAVAVSEDSEFKDSISIGDIIIFQRHEGNPINIDNIEHRTVKDRWIMGKLIGKEVEMLKQTHEPMRI